MSLMSFRSSFFFTIGCMVHSIVICISLTSTWPRQQRNLDLSKHSVVLELVSTVKSNGHDGTVSWPNHTFHGQIYTYYKVVNQCSVPSVLPASCSGVKNTNHVKFQSLYLSNSLNNGIGCSTVEDSNTVIGTIT